jgi:hypothetical protein
MARSAKGKTASLAALATLLLLTVSIGTGVADWPCDFGSDDPEPLDVVSFDLIPQTCPNPFQLSPPGLLQDELPAAVLGDEGFDVNRIDNNSLLLLIPGGGGLRNPCGQVPPLWTQPGDIATPYTGTDSCGCTTGGPDTWVDLQMGFSIEDIQDALAGAPAGEQVKIYITGTLDDGTPFIGLDCLLLVAPSAVEPSPWGLVKSEYR